ncbi:hypothetical protein DB88DRAFT_219488 [Papiliotrema laurentii]|uniref:YCII-related domain-containing protein n=1 Tax=Papiliotrema laurentii TaxID=5418 RepID=A0AAD9L7W9_PAPLA|nr:hypothetical protein DB88DRAFT_219488 [Papiliotrema laurentii]
MPFITSAASLRRLPLFFAYCPDKAGMLSKRMEVRPTHLARWSEEKDKGYGEFGSGYKPLNPSSSGGLEIDGSLMIFRAETVEKAWEKIKTDVYWTEGIWDQDKVVVREFLENPVFNDQA